MNKITISFDGGCRPTNPGNKYGSFEVCFNGRQVILISRQEFGHGTNNEAEFNAFEAALIWTVSSLSRAGNSPKDFSLEAYSDSTILVNRMKRKATSGKSEPQRRMANLCARCLNYTKLFSDFKMVWNSRNANVFKFGH